MMKFRKLNYIVNHGNCYFPWYRLSEIYESPTKLNRVKRLVLGNAPTKHPDENNKSALHEITLRAKYNSTTYIWGPPGTGKTFTLSRVVGQRYLNGKKFLYWLIVP